MNANIGEVGRDSGSPVLEGSLVYALPGVLSGPIQHGIWGLYGREDFDELDASFDQWGVGGHINLIWLSGILNF